MRYQEPDMVVLERWDFGLVGWALAFLGVVVTLVQQLLATGQPAWGTLTLLVWAVSAVALDFVVRNWPFKCLDRE